MMNELVLLNADSLKSLLVPERLDIIIKYLYIDAYINNKSTYVELYQRHIALRTGGIEDQKHSTKEYVIQFNTLIERMRANEFDKRYPIPVSKHNGIILDGAHRLACCLYFHKPAYIEYKDSYGSSWDSKWLYEHGFQDDLQDIFRKYIELKYETTFMAILWGPIERFWDQVETFISSNYKIVGRKDFTFNERFFPFLVEEIYSYEFGLKSSTRIKEKINFLSNFPKRLSLILFDVKDPKYETEGDDLICDQVFELKKKIREYMHPIVDSRKFATLHTSDSPEHTIYLSNILLNKESLQILEESHLLEPRQEFLNWLEEYNSVIHNLGLSKEDCCIVGSSSLEVLGIRESTDIDFILCERKRKTLFPETYVKLSPIVDIASKGYHEHSHKETTFSDDQIIYEKDKHFYYKGLKFATLSIIRDRKSYEKRTKDLKDVVLIDDFIKVKSNKRKIGLWKRFGNKLILAYKVHIIAYFRHGLTYKFKRFIWKHLSKKQREYVRRYLGKVRKTV